MSLQNSTVHRGIAGVGQPATVLWGAFLLHHDVGVRVCVCHVYAYLCLWSMHSLMFSIIGSFIHPRVCPCINASIQLSTDLSD